MKHTIQAVAVMLTLAGTQAAQAQEALFIDQTGLVGVGTTWPGYNLTISNENRAGNNNDKALGVDNNALFSAKNKDGNYEPFLWPRRNDDKLVLQYGRGGMELRNNDNAAMVHVTPAGNVGIGVYPHAANKMQMGGNLHMMGSPIFFKNDAIDSNAVVKWGGSDRMEMGGWNGVILGHTNKGGGKVTPVLTVNTGNVDIKGNADVEGNVITKLSGGNFLGTTRVGLLTQEYTGMEFTARPHNNHITPTGSGGIIKFYTYGYYTKGSSPSMIITEGGRVGIGTQTPGSMLEVTGSVKYNTLGGFEYMKNGTRSHHDGTQNRDGSIMAAEDICTKSHFVAYSDSRIKRDLRHSSPLNDLATLNKLSVTDYRYIDTFDHGNGSVKGLIAQEVETVYPEAVSSGTDFVPDIFATPKQMKQQDSTVTFTMARPHHLKDGNVVRLITPAGNKDMPVVIKGANTFSITDDADNYKETFVFGKQVDDFRRVDYDRVFTLNVSATQQLSKEVDALKAEVAALKQKNTELENSVMARLQKLEVASKTAGK